MVGLIEFRRLLYGLLVKESVESFIYRQRGSDKTLNRINDAIPHTRE